MLIKTSFRKGLEKTLFQIFIFLLPTQLAYHFWPDWAFIGGIRVDYLSPTIYLTDLLLFALFAVWLIERFSKRKAFFSKLSKRNLVFVALFVFSLLNIIYAQRPPASLLKWIKVYELLWLIYYLADRKKTIVKSHVVVPLSLAVVYSAVIAASQFFLQSTIGGPLYFLGERSFNAATPAIAKAYYLGRELMRPYSIFPHPNVLAGFVAASFIFLLRTKGKVVLKAAVSLFSLITFFLAASLGAWISLVAVSISIIVSNLSTTLFKRLVFFVFFLAVSFGLLLPLASVRLYRGEYGKEVLERMRLNIVAGDVLSQRPFLGVGLNNFLLEIPKTKLGTGIRWYLQPVHNIFLLVFVETGIMGVFVFVYFFWRVLAKSLQEREKRRLYVPVFLLIIVSGSFDHYWITLQQTQLLLAVFTGLALRRKEI